MPAPAEHAIGLRLPLRFASLYGLWPGAATAVLLTLWFTHDRLRLMEQTFDAGNQAAAQQIAVMADLSLYAGDIASLQALASRSVASGQAQRVEISNHAGIFVQAGPLPQTAASLAVATAPVYLARRIHLSDYPEPSSNALPAVPDNTLGTVRIYRSAALHRTARWQAIWQNLLPGALCLLGTALLTHRRRHNDSRKLQAIGQTLTALQTQQWQARCPPLATHGGTLGALGQSINTLAEHLQHHNAQADLRLQQAREAALEGIATLEQASRTRARFLASASHDLRQPLHALGLFIDSLRTADIPSQRTALARMQESIDIMGLLLDDLLDISRLDAKVLKPACTPVDLGALFAQIDAMHRHRAATAHIRLLWRSGPHDVVLADHTLLMRMLGNLVMNAIQHSHGKTVMVTARRCIMADGAAGIRVQVRDNGQGIAPLHHARIFEEFFQVANTGRDARKGFGLGLSICQRIAQVLGTHVTLQSGLQCGSTFAFALPCAPADRVARSPSSIKLNPMPATTQLPSLRCLVIDDDIAIREACAMLLRQWGCQVSTAQDSCSARQLLVDAGEHYDIVLCDLQLQHAQDGLAVLEAAAIHQPKAMRVLISGATAPDTLRQLRKTGILLLTKPVAPARLRALIMQVGSGPPQA